MSLIGALHVGRTGLAVSQTALEVAGNNLANAATEGYSRQTARIFSGVGTEVQPGVFLGTGVRLQNIVRQVDDALLGRLRAAVADQNAAQTHKDLLSQIESLQGELTDQSLTVRLEHFFDAWKQLAGNSTDAGLQSLVVSEGRSLAQFINTLHEDFTELRTQLDNSLTDAVTAADDLMSRIAVLNQSIVTAERGQGGANDLRDQRDRLLDELAEYFEITTIQQDSGAIDVLVGSIPVVLSTQSRGVRINFESTNEGLVAKLQVVLDGSKLDPGSGKIGQLIASRESDVPEAIEALDEFTHQLVFQINQLHSSGQSAVGRGFSEVTGTYGVDDPALALNDPQAGLVFTPVNGTFQFHLKQKSTGTRTTQLIQVDLDGIGADTTLNDLAAALAGPVISTSISASGRLTITSNNSDFEFSFSDDSSGVLAALGINSFFDGKGPVDLGVNDRLIDDPALLASTRNHVTGGNANALALASEIDQPHDDLGGLSLRELWSKHVQDFAVRAGQANNSFEASQSISQSLETQRKGVSGVNVDEESINLILYQRAFQGAARFISVIDELMDTLLGLVR
jgi:flagellar hook-associated protein 1 FlgK